MKLASLVSLLCGAVFVLALHADSPDQSSADSKDKKDKQAEVNVVLRISRKFISELTTKKFQRTDPVFFCALDSPISGTAQTDATFTVEFDSTTKDSAFVLQLQGRSTSATVAESTMVQVYGSGKLDFTVRKPVKFDGKKYLGQPSLVDANFCTCINGIGTPGGLVGWIIHLIAEPEARKKLPTVAEIAYANGRNKLTDAFEQETTKLLDKLNQISPLQETVESLYPETRDWILYPSASSTHLIIGTGPRDRRVPELPVPAKMQAPIQLWIRGRQETQGMLKVIKLWKDAGKQLVSLLPEDLRKEIKSDEGFKTTFVKEWFVIQIGTAGSKDQPQNKTGTQPVVVWEPMGTRIDSILPKEEATTVVWRPSGNTIDAAQNSNSPNAKLITVVWRPVNPEADAIYLSSSKDRPLLETPKK